MILKIIKNLAIFGVFIYPFVLFKSLAFPLAFSHVVFIFTIIEFSLLLYLLYSLEKGEFIFKKSYLTLGLVLYIIVLFITALTGAEFSLSFWSSYMRLTGIITWIHYFSFFLVLSSFFNEEDWKKIFRTLALSGLMLSLFSFLGVNGLALESFSFLEKGGSFLGNTSYSGAYMFLIFFFSFIGFSLESRKEWKIVYIVSLLFIFFNPDLFNFGIWNGSVPLKEVWNQPMRLVGLARTSALVLWGGILTSLILSLFHKLKNKKVTLILSSSFLLFLSIVYVFGFLSLMSGEGKLHNFYVEQSGPMRPMVWNMAKEGIKESPFLGYGDGNFKYVYQKHLDIRIIHLENPPWFDRVHNFTLEEILGHGILGAILLLGIFILICVFSFKFYLQNNKFYFLFIPFIFFLHFLQMQTFFQIDSTLLLSFILLAFLVSYQDEITFKVPWPKYTQTYQVGLIIIFIIAFAFYVVIPIKENRLLLLIKNTKARSERLLLQEKLYDLSIDPIETLRQVSIKFTDETVKRAQEIQKAGFTDNVKEEYKVYLDVYNKYLPRYYNSHRYLFEYANLINSAFVFGVNELEKGEILARRSLEISEIYPHPYWVLALNLYYQGKTDEALLYAKKAYDLDPTIKKSELVYNTLQTNIQIKSKQKAFFYLSDI